MKKIFFLMACMMMGLVSAPSFARAEVNIFACEPEWGALAEEIGGSAVSITTATSARQDVHHLRAKPSLMAAMRKSDLVFCTGSSLEVGWLPILLKKVGSNNVQVGGIGYLMASDHVDKLEVMEKADRSMGHVHPEGNPHIQLNPKNIDTVAQVLAKRLSMIDPSNAELYAKNLQVFNKKWEQATQRWNAEKSSLNGKNVVIYHNGWVYMLDWLGIKSVASLEPKPGIPPTASHLEDVLVSIKGQDVSAIIVAPFENEKPALWLSEKSGIPIIHLPYTVGGDDNAIDLVSLFDETINLLKRAR